MLFPPCIAWESSHGIKGIFTWDKIILDWTGLSPIWKSAERIGLRAPLSSVWVQVTTSLQACGIMRRGPSDHLYWFSPNAFAPICVKDIYSELITTLVPGTAPIFPTALWKTRCPPRMIFFAWLLFSNKNLTWDNLRKRSWHGPSRCSICETDEQSNFHIFFHCSATQDIWYELAHLYIFPHVVFVTVHGAFHWWSSQCEKRRPLLIITEWFVWRWRNHRIFNDSNVHVHITTTSPVTGHSSFLWHLVFIFCGILFHISVSRNHLHMMYPSHFFVSLCSLDVPFSFFVSLCSL